MGGASGQPPRGGLGRVIVGAASFMALVGPAALIALPLGVLLAVSHPRTAREFAIGAAAGGYALWWLLLPGTLPDQLLRAAAVVATAAFVAATCRSTWSVTHRVLFAAGAAIVAAYGWAWVVGVSWGEIRWWVEHEAGLQTRAVVGQLWSAAGGSDGGQATIGQVSDLFLQLVSFLATFYPAVLVFELWAAFALATALYQRLATAPRGRPLGRLRDFRFSEHLGWAAAIPLIVVLVPALASARTAAANVLLVAAGLYVARGLAVATFGAAAAGVGGALAWVVGGVAVILLLPVLLGGAIILGVVDAGLDLRRRWRAPRANW